MRRNMTLGRCAILAALAFLLAGLPAFGIVVPCPNQMVDSSGAIQAALESAPKGSTVSLEACTYYLANPIWVRTAFSGKLKGAGKDQTVITTLPGSKIDGISNPIWGMSLSAIFQFEVPLGEIGDITVSDLTVRISDPEPAGTQDYDYQGALYCIFVVNGTRVNTRFERLRLAAATGNFAGRNVAHAFHIGGANPNYMRGNHYLSDSDFENSAVSYDLFLLQQATITVSNNRFTNNFYGPLIEDCSECAVEIRSNLIHSPDYTGVQIVQGSTTLPSKASSYIIDGNRVEVSGIADGIVVADLAYLFYDGIPKLNTRISNNIILLNETTGGGIAALGVQKPIVSANTISGNGLAGIYAGPWGETIAGAHILNNNVQEVSALLVPIWLATGTTSCTVVGKPNYETLVLDEGTNNNLVNVTTVAMQAAPKMQPQAMKAIDRLKVR